MKPSLLALSLAFLAGIFPAHSSVIIPDKAIEEIVGGACSDCNTTGDCPITSLLCTLRAGGACQYSGEFCTLGGNYAHCGFALLGPGCTDDQDWCGQRKYQNCHRNENGGCTADISDRGACKEGC